jgi:hypothetical protein
MKQQHSILGAGPKILLVSAFGDEYLRYKNEVNAVPPRLR